MTMTNIQVQLDQTVFSVNLVCEKELNFMLKVSGLLVKVRWVLSLRGPDFFNKTNKVNTHDNKEMRGFRNTHSKGEQVKIPLLPNKVGKRSGTMTMVMTRTMRPKNI